MIQNRIAMALLIVAAVALPLRAASQTDDSGAKKLGWKLTLQTWTNNHKTVAEGIDLAHEIGVHYVEAFPGQSLSPDEPKVHLGPGMSDADIQKILDYAKFKDVKIIAYGVTWISGKEADARKMFDWAKKMGLATLVAEPDVSALPLIDKLAGEYHINVALHDHPKPARYWNPDFTWSHIKDLKHVGFCADVGHWKRSGLDPIAVLKQYAGHAYDSHFKDLVPGGGNHGLHDVVWGTGQSNAAAMLEAFKANNYHGTFCIEYEWHWTPQDLRKCVEWFNAEANKLAE